MKMSRLYLIFSFFLIGFSLKSQAQNQWQETQLIQAPEAQNGQKFGEIMDATEQYLVVSSPNKKLYRPNGTELKARGVVDIFKVDDAGENWTLIQSIECDSFQLNSRFGESIAIYDSTLFIGAPGNFTLSNDTNDYVLEAGAVYVYRLNSGTWEYTETITSPDTAKRTDFGTSIATYGKWTVIGAPLADFDPNEVDTFRAYNSGAAYVFKNNGTAWEFQHKVLDPYRNSNELFGSNIDLYGEHLVVAALHEDFDVNEQNGLKNAGAVFAYDLDNDTFQYTQKIVHPNRVVGLEFGNRMSLNSEHLIIAGNSGLYIPIYEFYSSSWHYNSGKSYYLSLSVERTFDINHWDEVAMAPTNGYYATQISSLQGSTKTSKPSVNGSISSVDCQGGSNIVMLDSILLVSAATCNINANHGVIYSFRLQPCIDKFLSSTVSQCGSWTSPNTGRTYTSSQVIIDTSYSPYGCRTIETFNLKIGQITDTTINLYNCGNSGQNSEVKYLTNINGCDSIIRIVVNHNFKPNTSIFFNEEAHQLWATTSDLEYQWLNCIKNYEAIEGETESRFTPKYEGFYGLEVTKGPCVDTTTCYYVSNERLEDPIPFMVKVYPNPSSGVVQIDVNEHQRFLRVEIIDLTGRVYLNVQYNDVNTALLDLPEKDGIYILVVHTSKNEPQRFKIYKKED
ncbi:T9SS type A sorting domain-containing protein [bacterium]|nr:T9SS type A sorting domain-containing protein [bacterium]